MTTHQSRREAATLLDAEAVSRTLARMAHELIERNDDLDRVALVGIHTRGVPIAQRLRGARRRAQRGGGRPGRRGHHVPP